VNPTFLSDSRYLKIGNHTSSFESGFKDDDGLKDMLRLPKLSFNPYEILAS